MSQTVDLAAYFAAVSRTVTFGAKGTATVRLRLRTAASRSDSWSALTTPDSIANWLLPIDGDLRRGGRYALQGNASGRIQHCLPQSEIGITWEYDDDISWVDVSLTDGHIQLDHKATVNPEHWDTFGPGAVGLGWDLAFLGLSRLLDQRPPIADAAQWQRSADGRRFIHGAASAWAAASAAAGDDRAAAKLAGARVAAAYLGEQP